MILNATNDIQQKTKVFQVKRVILWSMKNFYLPSRILKWKQKLNVWPFALRKNFPFKYRTQSELPSWERRKKKEIVTTPRFWTFALFVAVWFDIRLVSDNYHFALVKSSKSYKMWSWRFRKKQCWLWFISKKWSF